jgi:hypothetical protein
MKNLIEFSNFTKGEINEDNIGLAPTRQDSFTFVPGQQIVLDGSLFRLGVDKIDKNSDQYKKAVEALKNIGAGTVEVEGGASAVGSDRGYDNEALALRRASNFIKAAQADGVNAFMVPKFKVGVATIANSPAADAEQYVKINYKTPARGQTVIAIDNATIYKKPIIKAKDLPSPKPVQTGTEFKILKVTYTKGESSKMMTSLQGAAGRVNASIVDVSNDYNKKGYRL